MTSGGAAVTPDPTPSRPGTDPHLQLVHQLTGTVEHQWERWC